MNIWLTSDTHFGHRAILKYCQESRPFGSVTEMDEAIIERWNDWVKPRDAVYHMGDLSFHNAERTMTILNRLNGKIFLVKGNHDKNLSVIGSRFEWVKDYFHHKLNKRSMIMCHFAFEVWDKSHRGAMHVHGHSHGSLKNSRPMRRMDVGVDTNDLYPYAYEEVVEKLRKVQTQPVDHHDKETREY